MISRHSCLRNLLTAHLTRQSLHSCCLLWQVNKTHGMLNIFGKIAMRLWWNLIRQGARLLFITELPSSNTPSWWAHLNLRESISDWHVRSLRWPFDPFPSPVRLHRCLPCMYWHIKHTIHTRHVHSFSLVAFWGMAGKWKIWKGMKIQGRGQSLREGNDGSSWTWSWKCKTLYFLVFVCVFNHC